jgi:hypothetical protein
MTLEVPVEFQRCPSKSSQRRNRTRRVAVRHAQLQSCRIVRLLAHPQDRTLQRESLLRLIPRAPLLPDAVLCLSSLVPVGDAGLVLPAVPSNFVEFQVSPCPWNMNATAFVPGELVSGISFCPCLDVPGDLVVPDLISTVSVPGELVSCIHGVSSNIRPLSESMIEQGATSNSRLLSESVIKHVLPVYLGVPDDVDSCVLDDGGAALQYLEVQLDSVNEHGTTSNIRPLSDPKFEHEATSNIRPFSVAKIAQGATSNIRPLSESKIKHVAPVDPGAAVCGVVAQVLVETTSIEEAKPRVSLEYCCRGLGASGVVVPLSSSACCVASIIAVPISGVVQPLIVDFYAHDLVSGCDGQDVIPEAVVDDIIFAEVPDESMLASVAADVVHVVSHDACSAAPFPVFSLCVSDDVPVSCSADPLKLDINAAQGVVSDIASVSSIAAAELFTYAEAVRMVFARHGEQLREARGIALGPTSVRSREAWRKWCEFSDQTYANAANLLRSALPRVDIPWAVPGLSWEGRRGLISLTLLQRLPSTASFHLIVDGLIQAQSEDWPAEYFREFLDRGPEPTLLDVLPPLCPGWWGS